MNLPTQRQLKTVQQMILKNKPASKPWSRLIIANWLEEKTIEISIYGYKKWKLAQDL